MDFREFAERAAERNRERNRERRAAAPLRRPKVPGPLAQEAAQRAGCVQLRRARATGTVVGVYDGKAAGFDHDDGANPWSTVCETHGTIASHPTRALAVSHAADPEGWCEDCRTSRDG